MHPNGFVFYDGPSMLDGSPIVGIAVLHSENSKTGDMVQTYIIRSDMSPVEAQQTGADEGICGNCPSRPFLDGDCYVTVAQSVQSVHYAWVRGAYPLLPPSEVAQHIADREVRIGAYGDPAAIPFRFWLALIFQARGHTGYTHQWERFPEFRGMLMASVDSPEEAMDAHAKGWRTFRVSRGLLTPLNREFVCPASPEGGHRRQCRTCLACDGGSPPQASVVIFVHGVRAK